MEITLCSIGTSLVTDLLNISKSMRIDFQISTLAANFQLTHSNWHFGMKDIWIWGGLFRTQIFEEDVHKKWVIKNLKFWYVFFWFFEKLKKTKLITDLLYISKSMRIDFQLFALALFFELTPWNRHFGVKHAWIWIVLFQTQIFEHDMNKKYGTKSLKFWETFFDFLKKI